MIKELRKNMKATQKDFADYFEIPLKTVQGWEQGRRNPPEYLIKMMKRIWESDGKPIFEFENFQDFFRQLNNLDPVSQLMICSGKYENLSGNAKIFWIRYKNSNIDYKKIFENIGVDVNKQD